MVRQEYTQEIRRYISDRLRALENYAIMRMKSEAISRRRRLAREK